MYIILYFSASNMVNIINSYLNQLIIIDNQLVIYTTTLTNNNILHNALSHLKGGRCPNGDQLTLNVFTENSIRFLIYFFLQYEWNENEMFLFQATLAFAMRTYFKGTDFK